MTVAAKRIDQDARGGRITLAEGDQRLSVGDRNAAIVLMYAKQITQITQIIVPAVIEQHQNECVADPLIVVGIKFEQRAPMR